MQNVKPWQLVLFVLAALAVGFAAFTALRADRPKFSNEVILVDITTGELFSIDPSGKSIPVPARSPSTGDRNLFPVMRDDDGEWALEFRAFAQIQESRADTAEAIDMQTGKVLNAGDVKRITTRDLIKAIEAAG